VVLQPCQLFIEDWDIADPAKLYYAIRLKLPVIYDITVHFLSHFWGLYTMCYKTLQR